MRIVSLLPSLTELVCALGRGDELVGVTHECDFPPGVELLPHLTRSRIPADGAGARSMRWSRAGGEPLRTGRRPGRTPARPDPDAGAVRRLRRERGDRPASGGELAGRARGRERQPDRPRGGVRHVPPGRRACSALAPRPRRCRRFRRDGGRDRRPDRRAGRSPGSWSSNGSTRPSRSGHWNPEIVAMAGGREAVGRAGRAVAAVDLGRDRGGRPRGHPDRRLRVLGRPGRGGLAAIPIAPSGGTSGPSATAGSR